MFDTDADPGKSGTNPDPGNNGMDPDADLAKFCGSGSRQFTDPDSGILFKN